MPKTALDLIAPYNAAIERESALFHVHPSYLSAIILKESGAQPWRVRYEPGWHYFEQAEFWANKLGQSLDTEMACQKMSFGLCQIMGGTARWLGFGGYLTELLIPDLSIHWGAKLFGQKLDKYDNNYENAIAAYNAGNARRIGTKLENQAYVDSVMAIRRTIF